MNYFCRGYFFFFGLHLWFNVGASLSQGLLIFTCERHRKEFPAPGWPLGSTNREQTHTQSISCCCSQPCCFLCMRLSFCLPFFLHTCPFCNLSKGLLPESKSTGLWKRVYAWVVEIVSLESTKDWWTSTATWQFRQGFKRSPSQTFLSQVKPPPKLKRIVII